ncbi:MAG: Ldh family oxidoreductase [Candidatus Desulforudis sp.]|nr:Ldh family oxidoreductase [Desulforudis sp.]
MELKVPPANLRQFCMDLLVGARVPPTDARVVATVLVDASLDGIDTHGVSRLPVYLKCLQNGRINPVPEIKVARSAPAAAVLDGDHGLGQLVAVRAMEQAITLAAEAGVGVVAVRHSNHFGAASYYCKMAVARNMIGLAFSNSAPGIPPWGGRRAYFGTNPVAFGFPAANSPVMVDMSLTKAARGNVILAAREGTPIPAGWALDAAGRPTTDPREALAGAVLPFGGPKGYALALAVEVLCGVLSGAGYGPRVGWIYDDGVQPADVGHFFIAIDIASLMPLSEYISRMESMKAEVTAVPAAEGAAPIRLPGERRRAAAVSRSREGIPMEPALLSELNELAVRLNVATLIH